MDSGKIATPIPFSAIVSAVLASEILLAWREERLPAEVEAFIKEMEFEED